MRFATLRLALSVIAVSGMTMLGAGPAAARVGCFYDGYVAFHLAESGGNLTLNDTAPTGSTAKFIDSPALTRGAYQAIGTWTVGVGPSCEIIDYGQLEVWLGLRNSDDQGTNFDLKAELFLDGATIPFATAERLCIKGLTRNPALAKFIDPPIPFSGQEPISLGNGELRLKLSARIGSPQCGGHASATGLRLYYDSTGRDSLFDLTILDDAT